MASAETDRTRPADRGDAIPLSIGHRRFNESYGRVVGWLKVLLPTVAVVMIALVFLWPYVEEEGQRIAESLTGAGQIIGEHLEVSGASYSGVGTDGQSYTLTADGVQQASLEATLVTFTQPRADISLSDGSWALVSAETGTFDRDAQVLELHKAVNLFHDLGYEFRTESATLDLLGGSAYGFDPVSGQGPFGFVEAEGFQIVNRGERVQLTGRARVVIFDTD